MFILTMDRLNFLFISLSKSISNSILSDRVDFLKPIEPHFYQDFSPRPHISFHRISNEGYFLHKKLIPDLRDLIKRSHIIKIEA